MRTTIQGLTIALLMAAAMATAACSSNDDADVISSENNPFKPIELTDVQTTLVHNSNDFAFNLFRKAQEDKSMILSPLSITYALGMLNNGASGQTQQEILDVLGFGSAGPDAINAFCQKMQHEAPRMDQLTKVLISNTIFTNKPYTLKPSFVKTAQDFYDATPETRDFHDGKTRDVINQWASDHTEHMIEELFTSDAFNPDAVSYLLNAIYFKGSWASKFDKADTHDESFEGCDAKVPMMHQEAEFHYRDNDIFQAVELPYGNGAFSMTVLLPEKGKTLADVAAALTADYWDQQKPRYPAIVDLKLPSFETKSNFKLVELMEQLGMKRAFNGELAEFPDFCNRRTYIGTMIQSARIKLNEEGTEAAAVTAVGMLNALASSSPGHAVFHATRPFLYIISEKSTGTIFFIGQYTGKS
ncbi:MAG: serpin family protein [Prevotella sp.]|nr:serpin family protein [Prevotella sp.]